MDELDERLETVFAARTLGELAPPLADLPDRERGRDRPRVARTPLLGLVALLVTGWALTGAGAFWPLWVLVGLWWFGALGPRHRWAGRRSAHW